VVLVWFDLGMGMGTGTGGGGGIVVRYSSQEPWCAMVSWSRVVG